MINRRRALRWCVGGLAAPLAALAQTSGKKSPRVGFLVSETLADQASRIRSMRAGLEDHGYVEGRNLYIEIRSAESHYDRLPGLAAELVALPVDVLVAFGVKALAAASTATKTVPIVIPATSSDLVAMGFVETLAHPAGNVTGSTTFGAEVMTERLELLKEVSPTTHRVAILVNPSNSSSGPTLKQVDTSSKPLHLSIRPIPVSSAAELDRVFAAVAQAGMDAIVIQDDTMFGEGNAKKIADLAATQRLLAVGGKDFAEAGGTLGYGRIDTQLYRRGAYFVDRILKGDKAGDLPIEQARRFELVINMKTAQALGIRIPESVMLRADRLIE